ncbi:MAG TPA: BadF/BadG/BcrA/BcrD ATPase family protein [Solirubrobacteraceae bacterium]|jgi:glucosamine kinase|nr:BadF/BadG/BcrA/BcrD ATPase family protein [Solirubrobacteraceae bacterium]
MNRDSLVELPPRLAHPGSLARGRYLLAIDGGATKTLAAVLDLDEHAVHLAEGGPSNEDAVGSKAAVEALLDVAAGAMRRAGIEERELATAVLAVAGTDTDAIARQVQAARSDDWIVVNDVVGAWAVATGARAGVGAISGTGSNVFGVGSDARAWRVGGWGHLLGDEGSGYWLGVASIRAALADRDGSGPQTALSDAAAEFFDAPSVEALAALVYSKPLTKGEIASFAAETARLADAGDAVACELYTRGAHELAGQILTVIAHTGLGADGVEFPVGLIGSAYKAGAVFVDPLAAAVQEHAPNARIATVELAPVGGALQLAARACGCAEEIGPDELARLIDTAER